MIPGYTREGGNTIVWVQSRPDGMTEVLKPAIQWLLP